MTITIKSAVETSDSKICMEGLLLTADYHLTRDGSTIVGLITCIDALIEGPLPDSVDYVNTGDELARVQKLLVDKPLAMNVRVYGETLVIGNVRLPDGDGVRGASHALTMLGGRYNAIEDKKVLQPRAVKLSTPFVPPGMRHAEPAPSYIPPPPHPNCVPASRGLGAPLPFPPSSGYGYSIPLPPLPENVPNTLPDNERTLILPTPTVEPPIVQASVVIPIPKPERGTQPEAITAPRVVPTPMTTAVSEKTPKKKKPKTSGQVPGTN
jgi:hypothetical protein